MLKNTEVTETVYYMQCDYSNIFASCEYRSDYQNTDELALKIAKEMGWKLTGDKDICPSCQNMLKQFKEERITQ